MGIPGVTPSEAKGLAVRTTEAATSTPGFFAAIAGLRMTL
jgi:hypothetical protein